MRYRRFGKTGAHVSALGFGAMRLPMIEKDGKHIIEEDKAIEVIQHAYKKGINYFDTAPGYCSEDSERVLGLAVKEFRDKIYISTKNSIQNASSPDWRKRLENSLTKLDMDHVDFYHMWGISLKTYQDAISLPDGVIKEAIKAKEEGLIKHISVSVHDTPENIIQILNSGHFESVLLQYNLLDRANEPVIERANELDMGVVVMGPVGGGRLGGFSQKISDMLGGQVKSNVETALRFVLANGGVSCALSGMTTKEMVDQNVEIASRESHLTEQEKVNIEASLDECRELSKLYCTGCNYCMPCPKGVDIPTIFRLMNEHRIYGLTDISRRSYQDMGVAPWDQRRTATSCVRCGACEKKCPQHIKIMDQLQECERALGAEK